MPANVIKRVESLAAKDGFHPHVEPIFRTYALLAGVDEYEVSYSDETEEEEVDDDDDDDGRKLDSRSVPRENGRGQE
jgi:hypothetical protein